MLVNLEHLDRTYSAELQELHALDGLSKALYEEMGKIGQQRPAEVVRDAALEPLNDAIQQATRLLAGYPALRRIKPYTLLMGNPPYCDAVLTLRLIRQGLEQRLGESGSLHSKIQAKLIQARMVRAVLDICVNVHKEPVFRKEVEDRGVETHADWFHNYQYTHSRFNFAKLDSTSIPLFFHVC